MAQNVKLAKLIDGTEILAEIIIKDASSVTVRNPVRVIVVPSKTDARTPTVGFAPWAEFSEEKEFTIHRAHIITLMVPVKDFVNQYNSIFGGIITPTSKIITP